MQTSWRKNGERWRLELKDDGQVLSRLDLLRRDIRCGRAVLSTGGIASVHTEEAQRKRGHASLILRECLGEMQRRRYALGLLYGINDFYDRFAYASVDPVASATIDPSEILFYNERSYRIRSFVKTRDGARLTRFYNRANAERIGTAVRSESIFRQLRDRVIVAVDARDRLMGYAIYADECDKDGDRFHVWEVEGRDTAAYYSLLHALAARAQRLGAKNVLCWTLVNHPLMQACSRYRANCLRWTNRNGGGMARIIDIDVLAKQMLPEWAERWRRARPSFKGQLSIRTDIGEMALRTTAAGLARTEPSKRATCDVYLPQSRLVQLLFSYRAAADIALEKGVEISRRGLELLDVLFPPNQCMGSWYSDEF